MKNNKANKKLYIEDLINIFIEEKELENKSEHTIRYYQENLNRFWNFLIDHQGIDNATVDDWNMENVNEYRRYLKTKNKEISTPTYERVLKEKIADNSYRTYIRAIRAFGNWLYQQKYTEFDILKYIEVPKEQRKNVKILDEEEIKSLFDCFDLKTETGFRDYLITRFAFDFGFRLGTIIKIQKEDIDFKAGTVRVWLKGNKDQYPYRLDKEMKLRLQKFISKYGSDSKYLFTCIDGKPLNNNAMNKIFRRLKEKAGIKELSCHMLRHNFATNYITMGHSVEDLKYALGHETTQMSERYFYQSRALKHLTKEHDSMLTKVQKKEIPQPKNGSYLKRKVKAAV